MRPYWEDDAVTLHLGDCLDVLRTLPDSSVDAVVTDPPYELGFMGKGWDASGIAYDPALWAEVLRVLRPGGHLLAFGGTRTYHRMACAVEDAGFEVRDSVLWVYGSGFPKSLDVGRAIDKAAGAEREVVGTRIYAGGHVQHSSADKLAPPIGTFARSQDARQQTAPATEDAARWDGWGTALKPSHEPVILARRPLSGTVAQTVLEHGTGALNVAACRVPATPDLAAKNPHTRSTSNGFGEERAGALYDPSAGRWPTNVMFSHPPHLVDGEVVGDACASGCVDGCPVAELDRQSGASISRVGKPRGAAAGTGWGMTKTGAEYADEGGASRFFPTFRYEAKAPASERPRLPDGTAHATVKPLALMRWLVRLVTPPGGTVLDPFAGSGTTGEAAVIEGFRAVLIEREAPHAELIKARLGKPIAPVLDIGELT